MRLTNVARMSLPPGRLLSLGFEAEPAAGQDLPVSFDQQRHVGEGQRPGSWMGGAVRIPSTGAEDLAAAWAAAVARHGTLQTAFRRDGSGDLRLEPLSLRPGRWQEHPRPEGTPVRQVLRAVLDETCAPFERPAHRLAVVVPDEAQDDPRPVAVIAADHSHLDMWSLLVLVRDLHACLDDVRAGRTPGAGLPPAPSFAEHTAMLAARPAAPAQVHRRWERILDAEGGVMPRFPLPLGDLDRPLAETVTVRDVLTAGEVVRLARTAAEAGTRSIALAFSAMTRATLDLTGRPLRAVFPVHSRHEDRWHDSVGWFITNSVLECDDADPAACLAAVRSAIDLGSHPLGPILAPYGGMPVAPGMFAISWLDTRRLPVRIPPGLELQYVSAAIRTDGVMAWFILNDAGLHLRCRFPATPQAQTSVRTWLDAVEKGLRALV